MWTFNRGYFALALVLFVVEVLIALYVSDRFIRPYVGDYLVVILLYCAVRSVVNLSAQKVAAGVLLFSYCIEVLQYYRLVDRLGLSGNKLAKTVIGYGFSWWDMLAYTLGVVTVLLVEKSRRRKSEGLQVTPGFSDHQILKK